MGFSEMIVWVMGRCGGGGWEKKQSDRVLWVTVKEGYASGPGQVTGERKGQGAGYLKSENKMFMPLGCKPIPEILAGTKLGGQEMELKAMWDRMAAKKGTKE